SIHLSLRGQKDRRGGDSGNAPEPSADRQVDILHKRSFHHGKKRQPLHRIRTGRGSAGTCAERENMETGSRDMRGCVRGTARDLLRIKRARGVICVLRSNVPAATTNPQSRKGAERSPSAAPPRALTALGWILRRSTWTSAPDIHAASLGSSAVKE